MKLHYELKGLEAVGIQLLKNLTTKTVLLYGDMGVGKTTLIKALVKAMGSTDIVSSPTFSIVNEYKTTSNLIYHLDLYRIKDLEEAHNFGIEDYVFSKHWVIIEWPEILENMLPEKFDRIQLVLNPDHSRTLKLNFKSNINQQKH